MAPTRAQQTQLIVTSLVSYNRPFYLLLTFVVTFALIYYLSKKKVMWAFAGALLVTFLEAFYFAATFISNVRY